jgi:hypothetical protein
MKIKIPSKQEQLDAIRKQLPALQDELQGKIAHLGIEANNLVNELDSKAEEFYRGKK